MPMVILVSVMRHGYESVTLRNTKHILWALYVWGLRQHSLSYIHMYVFRDAYECCRHYLKTKILNHERNRNKILILSAEIIQLILNEALLLKFIIFIKKNGLHSEYSSLYHSSELQRALSSGIYRRCSPLKVNRRFGGTCRLHRQGREISLAGNQNEIVSKQTL
jgi:hypothetical protein